MSNNLTGTKRRMTENEAVFRQYNEAVSQSVENIEIQAESAGKTIDGDHKQLMFHFFCECSDENCDERIELKLETYHQIHMDRKQFIVKPGHESDAVESVVERSRGYRVVRKHTAPINSSNKLETTPVNNV